MAVRVMVAQRPTLGVRDRRLDRFRGRASGCPWARRGRRVATPPMLPSAGPSSRPAHFPIRPVEFRLEPRAGPRPRHWPQPLALAGEVDGPMVHQESATLEQVRARVGRLDVVPDDVSQRGLNNLPRVVRFFGRPVPEAGSEAVRHGRDVQVLEQLRQERVPDAVAPAIREHERAAVRERPRRVEDLQRPRVERGPGARGSSSCAVPGRCTRGRRCRSRPSSPAAPPGTAPPCGCGNSLIIAYRELRTLETDVLREMASGFLPLNAPRADRGAVVPRVMLQPAARSVPCAPKGPLRDGPGLRGRPATAS